MTFIPIYKDSSLFGYVEIRKMNVDENLKNTFKYVVLDKIFKSREIWQVYGNSIGKIKL